MRNKKAEDDIYELWCALKTSGVYHSVINDKFKELAASVKPQDYTYDDLRNALDHYKISYLLRLNPAFKALWDAYLTPLKDAA